MADSPALDVWRAASVVVEPGPFVSEFAAWLDAGHGVISARSGHVRDAAEFLAWYDVNSYDDVISAARQFGEFGTHKQASSMRLLVEWLGES